MLLLDAFSKLPDPRADNHRHPLSDLVFIAITMVLCGADDWEMVVYLAKNKKSWLKQYIALPHDIPSHDTFSRVFARLKPEAFQHAFISWVAQISSKSSGEIISIDGKTLRRSYDKNTDKAPIHMVNAWASKTSMILGQTKTDAKSNEITAIPTLLDRIEISGALVTIDAMGCQRHIAEKIVKKDANYLLALKGNQGTLFEDVKLFLDELSDTKNQRVNNYHETLEKAHGRIEIRRCFVSHDIDWLQCRHNWPNLKQIGMVESERHIGNKISIQRRYYICSKILSNQEFLNTVRSHWQVESMHWVLDIAFREDECRIRKDYGAENMALFRQITLNTNPKKF